MWFILPVAVFCSLAAVAALGDPVSSCSDQAVIAEHAAGIPDGLLLAIGKRESGRYDPATGATLPWPWSVNRDGESHVFDSKDEAVAYATEAEREGSRSIDVGCFQINLKYHPGAFASLDEAFDPAANAAYAAQFLQELHDRAGNWETAVGNYHSATAWFGDPYRDAVLAIWHGLPPAAELPVTLSMEPTRVLMGIRIFEPSVRSDSGRLASAPAGPFRTASMRGEIIPMIAPRRVNGLPRVITPNTVVVAR